MNGPATARTAVAMSPYYAVGRLAGVLGRPLFLLAATNLLSRDAAQAVAVAIVAVALAMLLTAADAHRALYVRVFAAEPKRTGIFFYTYIGSMLALVATGSVLIVLMNLRYGVSGATVAAAIAYFVSEKISDEVLRLRLFEERFDDWGRSLAARMAVQFAALVVAVAAFGGETPGALAVAGLAIGNMVVFVPQLPRSLVRVVRPSSLATIARLISRGVARLAKAWHFWMIALVSASIGYVDRLMTMVIDQAYLPIFVLIVMSFSIVQLSVDFFFLARSRRFFLQGTMSVSEAVLGPMFLSCLTAGAIAGALASLGVLRYADGGALFPFSYVVAIGFLHVALAATLVPREIVYWGASAGSILRVDGSFWLLLLAGVGVTVMTGISSDALIVVTIAAAYVRFAAYVVLARRRLPGVPVPPEGTIDAMTMKGMLG